MPLLHGTKAHMKNSLAVFADRSSSRAGELDGQAAMHLCIAFIALVAVMMMGAVVEHVFVLSRGRRLVPGAFERSFLFAYVAVGFDRIGKIGVEVNLQVELNLLQREICAGEVFVHSLAC